MNHEQSDKQNECIILIAGYIRQIQNIFQDTLIPAEINTICLQYYIVEKWDPNDVGQNITINGDTMTYSVPVDSYHSYSRSAYFFNRVSEGVHIWKIKINQLQWGYKVIGIWKTRSG
eukprot:837402_1